MRQRCAVSVQANVQALVVRLAAGRGSDFPLASLLVVHRLDRVQVLVPLGSGRSLALRGLFSGDALLDEGGGEAELARRGEGCLDAQQVVGAGHGEAQLADGRVGARESKITDVQT